MNQSNHLSLVKRLQYVPLLLLTVQLACQKPAEGINPGDPARPDSLIKATPTAIGQPIGVPTTKTIGPAGGTLVSADNKIRLDIPVGALRKETTITLQPNENMAPNGAGTGFTISPTELTFDQPVVVAYTFQDEEMNGVSIDAMGLAFQDDQRGWQQTQSFKVDKATKTAKVTVKKADFWALLGLYALTPEQTVLTTGETKELMLTRVGQTDFSNGAAVTPLIPQDARADIARLSINGVDWTGAMPANRAWGSVSYNQKTLQLLYVAPNKKPSENNPLALGIEIKNPGSAAKLSLYSIITIEAENTLTINNHQFDNTVANGSMVKGQFTATVAGTDSNGKTGQLSLAFPGLAVGAHSFTPAAKEQEQTTYIGALNGAGKTEETLAGNSFYSTCTAEKTEGGIIQVLSVEAGNNGYSKIKLNLSGSVVTVHSYDPRTCQVTVHKTMPVSANLTILFRH